MNKILLSDAQLTFLHHIFGHIPTRDLIKYILTNIKDADASKEMHDIGVDVDFIDYLYEILDKAFEEIAYQKYAKAWKNAVANNETTLSLKEYYHLTINNNSV